jgi:hypothetical protein
MLEQDSRACKGIICRHSKDLLRVMIFLDPVNDMKYWHVRLGWTKASWLMRHLTVFLDCLVGIV